MAQDQQPELPAYAGPDPDAAPQDMAARVAPARRWRRGAAILGIVLIVSLAAAWLLRKDIADNLIGRELEALGLPARYDIVTIGPSEQVIRHLSIGDPARPDLTVEEVRVATRLYWGLPGIGRITLVKPRLYGRIRGARPSFGSLDRVLFSGKGGPFEMPDLDVAIVDGRSLIESDWGRIGIKLAGEGPLRGGFSGQLAAIAPTLAGAGCTAGRTTIYGTLATRSQQPRFNGPVRTEQIDCPASGLSLGRAEVQATVTLDRALDGGEGVFGLALKKAQVGESRVASASGELRTAYRKRALAVSSDVMAHDVVLPQARFASLGFEGRGRSNAGLAHFDVDGDLTGKGISLGQEPDRALSRLQQAGTATLVEPLAVALRNGLANELRGSALDANVIVRRSPEGLSLAVPRGNLRGGSGTSILALSRVHALVAPRGGVPRMTGNFVTGGRGLPQAWGRMESDSAGRFSLRASMPDYHAGDARLSIPRLDMTQRRDGAIGFTGQVGMSGALPGGHAQNLFLPLEGHWAANGDLAVWRTCTDISFDSLRLSNLALDRRKLRVCPAAGSAVLSSRAGRIAVAAGVPSLDVAGRLGGTPIRIASGAVGYAQNGNGAGVLNAKGIAVTLGPPATASRFAISHLDARVGQDVAGTFSEADLGLYAVPLDMRQTDGNWSYAEGVLAITDARFTLVDRQQQARFEPMVAQGGTLRLANNRISARMLLREPKSGREVVQADIVHDLTTGTGRADLGVNGIVFDSRLQAYDLSKLVLGVVSNLKGVVDGTGRIDWNANGVRSRGRFASKGLDFAAAFGPVKGLSGDVVFTDLLGLVTAPEQKVHLASVNPGIEVNDGTLSFQLEPGFVLRVNGAHWPFMEGTLTLDPSVMRIGVAETRRYTLRVTGLNAASFVQRLELANVNASGTFDGELPLVFDENGGRIENGRLISREPGGNVSYLGALTEKDLSAMGNFAFDALKSVNYRRMEIGLGGSLSGDIVTSISFDGLSQGAIAKRNFITRQIAKLPIRFLVNVKAPFYSLFGSMRSLYDPEYVTDPRVLGLLDADGVRRENAPDATVIPPTIQPPVSGNER